jgi:amino acid efflux transporter
MAELASTPPAGLRKEIRLRHAVALYVSSVLGSGVLVLPGLTARIAGPASLVAWAALAAASYPFAYTFASLSARSPQSGGVYAFAREAFGLRIATVSGWLFVLWYVTGAPAVTLIAASYVSYAFPLTREGTFLVAAAVLVGAWAVNRLGIEVSNRVQVAVTTTIVLLLVCAVAFSIGSVRLDAFSPVFPHGALPVGTAAALIFWSFLGYENVSNVAEEFRDPRRDFKRSIGLSVVLIGGLYLAVAFVTVGTRAYASGGSVAPFAAIFSNVVGRFGAVGTAAIAVFIIFSTANAYTAGMSRVILAVARDGGFPRGLDHVDARTGVPDRSLALLFGASLVMLAAYYALEVDLDTALLIPSGAAILVYVIGSAAGIRLLRGGPADAILPWVSLAVSLSILPFVGRVVAASIAIVVAGLAYGALSEQRA